MFFKNLIDKKIRRKIYNNILIFLKTVIFSIKGNVDGRRNDFLTNT